MEFFNKKQDVIELKLTQFGRHLLSKGLFKPEFYAFYDDNVLYNADSAGITIEEQNSSQERIREAQTMKPQISFSSLEKEFKSNYNLILSGEETAGAVPLQKTAEKFHSLPQPLGTSDINSDYSPSWTVKYLNGNISGSVDYMSLTERSGGKNILKIPQLEADVEIRYIDVTPSPNDDVNDLEEYEDGSGPLSNLALASEDDETFTLIKIVEQNAEFQKKNFDIEVFEIIENTDEVTGETTETLRQLQFSHSESHTDEMDIVQEPIPDYNHKYADFYFDIFVDDEISDKTLCKYDPVNENESVFADERDTLCRDILNDDEKKIFNIYLDESDNAGEAC
tara:strand:+ start:2708 stop:3721 length:1014 start_codon:yes stop_codon:yes gene_type:complete